MTPYKKIVEGCDIRGIWAKTVRDVNLEQRMAAVVKFNQANKYKKKGFGA
jgi:xanthine dehydrogenase molybdopterin-binding subunit B